MVRHFAEFLQRELADKITRELKAHTIISDQLRHLVLRCLADTTEHYLNTRREIMPSSPRYRSISDFAESPSPISHAESSPLATTDMRLNDCNTDSGYCSMGNNPQAQGQWSFGPPQGRMLCDVPRVSGPQSDLVVPLPSPPWATNFDFSPLNYFGE